jgi:hypothetical protein
MKKLFTLAVLAAAGYLLAQNQSVAQSFIGFLLFILFAIRLTENVPGPTPEMMEAANAKD